jgi:hypothetical protein
MSNTYYMACSGCDFLLGSTDDFVKCPHCIKNVGVYNIGDAEDYYTEDEEEYNNGFPYGEKHSCKRCNYGKKNLS